MNGASIKETLKSELRSARDQSDRLFRILREEAMHDRPILERHRILFYLGHLEAFDWNLICRDSMDLPPFNPEFDKLFAFGIDPVDGSLPTDQPSDWPALEHVGRYNQTVRTKIDSLVEAESFDEPSVPNFENRWAFNVAIEHRLMHVETLAYMFHWLPHRKKIRQPSPLVHSITPPERRTVPIHAGIATLGIDRAENAAVGWDNEYQVHTVEVPEFLIDAHNVTNGEYLRFVEAGGYDDPSIWRGPDWAWKEEQAIRHPRFWRSDGDRWHHCGMFADHPLPPDWPVCVSHAEASAYAKWRGASLPSEAQYHRAAYGTPEGEERLFPWGNCMPATEHGNFDSYSWNPNPIGHHQAGLSAFGVADLVGNGWEWTSTKFLPFPGFEPLPFYPTYSANFFDDQHYVMKGGSWRTAARLLRRSFRNWFQPHYPYIYATFRCVEY